jgi:hypothetical protein
MTVIAEWHDFLVTTTGAAAGLGGLIIVAMSVNVAEIIKIPSMPSRAASTIAGLVLVVVVGAAGLIPTQPLLAYGLEVLVFSGIAALLTADSIKRIYQVRRAERQRSPFLKSALSAAQVLPFLVGGILLLVGGPGAMDWVAAGTLLVFIGSVVNAWVLLIEIRR